MRAVQMTHATQIAFPLFSRVGHKEQGATGNNGAVVESGGQRPEGGQPAAIVSYAGTEQAIVLAAHVERRARWKYRIEMRAEGDGRAAIQPGTRGQQIACGIRGGDEAKLLEAMAEPLRSRLLAKGRRGNGGDGQLKFGDITLVAQKPIEERVDARVGGKTRNFTPRGRGRRRLTPPRIPHAKRHLDF